MNKDTGVAHGAALYAAKVNSNLTEKFKGPLLDSTAKMMAIRKEDGEAEVLWLRNTSIPFSEETTVKTT